MRDLRQIFLRSLPLTILLLTAQTTAVHAQAGKLLPVDEADRDPELFAFRARLQEARASMPGLGAAPGEPGFSSPIHGRCS